jgi:tetratricopeptide (TPR) repeat protein
MRLLSPLVFLLLFTGCAAVAPDPQTAENFRRQAEELVAVRDFITAADRLGQAIDYQPEDSSLYLRRGELLERSGDLNAARRIYRRALNLLPDADPQRPEIIHHLALLYALKLDGIGKARGLLPELPEGSAARADLLGVLALQGERGKEALQHFDQALARNPGDELAAAILYHASLASYGLGDEKTTLGNLYQAAMRTSSPALSRDIEILWERIDKEMPEGRLPDRKANP